MYISCSSWSASVALPVYLNFLGENSEMDLDCGYAVSTAAIGQSTSSYKEGLREFTQMRSADSICARQSS